MKTKHPTTMLKLWMREASPAEQEELAQAVGSSRGHLYQVAGGFRRFGPAKAAAVERKAAEMHRDTKGRLPKVYRTDLALECAACEYAQKCLGAVASRGEFPMLEDDGEVTDHND